MLTIISKRLIMSQEFRNIFKERSELSVRYDAENAAVWCYFNPKDRPRYSTKMLQEGLDVQKSIIEYFEKSNMSPEIPIRYFVVASQSKDIYIYGGDLDHFAHLITNKDRDGLLNYAQLCVENVYLTAVNLHLPITTISVVEGVALGGGFESVLSNTIVIAEEKASMGFPEIRFNLFPGMGAYSFLARMHGIQVAEEIITSGKIYTAEELHKIGIVNQLVKDGTGIEKAKQFMRKHSRHFNARQALQKVQQRYSRLSYDEMMDITEIWVDTALQLTDSDLKIMKRLVSAQNSKNINNYKVRTHQDRRIDLGDIQFPLVDTNNHIIVEDRRKSDKRRA